MRVRDIMTTTLHTVDPLTPVPEVFSTLRQLQVRHVPVVDAEGRVHGIISDRDLLSRGIAPLSWLPDHEQAQQLDMMGAREVMSDHLVTIAPDAALADAARLMLDRKLGSLLVLDEHGKLVGILTEADFVALALKAERTA